MDDIQFGIFVWSAEKERLNFERHGVGFVEAGQAFADPQRLLIEDMGHSKTEERFYCIGRVGESVITVRFTPRGDRIRIIGAGAWRKWRKYYEQSTKESR